MSVSINVIKTLMIEVDGSDFQIFDNILFCAKEYLREHTAVDGAAADDAGIKIIGMCNRASKVPQAVLFNADQTARLESLLEQLQEKIK